MKEDLEKKISEPTSTGGEKSGQEQNQLSGPSRTKLMVLGWIVLVLSIVGGSFAGTSSNLLHTEISWVKTCWAQALRVVYCTPLVVAEVCLKQDYRQKLWSALTRRNVCTLLLIQMLYSFWCFGLLYGADNMIQSHAYICNTMFSIFVVLFGYCLCLKPSRLELLGLFLTIVGVAMMFNDSKAERTDGKVATWWHYAVCISAAFGVAIYFMFNGYLVKAFPLFTLLLLQSLIGYVYIVILLFALYPSQFSLFSMDRDWGGFGLFHPEEAFYAIVCFGMTSGFWGSLGFVIALYFFSPVIVSASILFLPFLGQLIGYWMDIDMLPGWLTWSGTVCVFFGVLGI